MDFNTVLFAFGLTLFAGLSTGIGSLLVLITKKTNPIFLSASLGFSAGVMVYISFMEILPEANIKIASALGEKAGGWAALGGFFFGIFLIAAIDKLIPSAQNPHEAHTVEELDGKSDHHKSNLMRMGVLTALTIAIHNFPEGLATFTSALVDPKLGVPIAVAVAIHNIPEGIAVAVPIFYSTGSRKKAFKLSFLSGLSEPAGAIIGYILLFRFMNDLVMGLIFAVIAGIMVFISFDELLPAAKEYGEHHISIYGLVAGMAVMAISLLIL